MHTLHGHVARMFQRLEHFKVQETRDGLDYTHDCIALAGAIRKGGLPSLQSLALAVPQDLDIGALEAACNDRGIRLEVTSTESFTIL